MDVLQAMRILIPPAWQTVDNIDPDVRAFYEYYGAHVEPWDGPAGIVLTNGRYAACVLDRNGLRPARYVLTRDRHLTIASEVGVYDYRPEDVVAKGRLGPGQMMAADLESGELLDTQRIEELLKNRAPYKKWLKQGVRYLDSELVDPRLTAEPMDTETLARYQKMFSLSYEERNEVIGVLAETELEAVGSMGDDTPIAGVVQPYSLSVRFLPSTVCPGHQSTHRFAAGTHGDVAADGDRSRVQHLRASTGARTSNHHEFSGVVTAQVPPAAERCRIGSQSSGHRSAVPTFRRPAQCLGGDLPSGRGGGACQETAHRAHRPLSRDRQDAGACASGHRGGASPPGAHGIAVRLQHAHRDRDNAGSPSLRVFDRLWGGRRFTPISLISVCTT